MNKLRIAFARVRGSLFKNRLDSELSEEIESHVAMEVDENLRRGMTPDEARYAAVRRFGGVAQVQEAYRDRRGFPVVEEVSQDLRYAARGLARNRVFTAVVILTLAVSIGVNTAIFTLFDLALRPLGVRDPSNVVNLDYQSAPGASRGFSYPNYAYLRDHAHAFSGLVGSAEVPLVMAGHNGPGDSQQISATFVSGNFFSVLGDAPALGRTFTQEQDRVPGRDAFVVLSFPFWQRHFGADPSALGQTVRLGGVSFSIIGVTARDFVGLEARVPDVWLPLMMLSAIPPGGIDKFEARGTSWLNVTGRLKPGRTLPEAKAEVAVLASHLARMYPETDGKAKARVYSGSMFGELTPERWAIFLMVMAATGMVLLIACANIANLLLARATRRQKEIGLRFSLGASRSRLIRQLVTESLLLAGLGGGAGLLLAWWSLEALLVAVVSIVPPDFGTIAVRVSPDVRVVIFVFALTLLTCVGFGLAPAFRATRVNLATTLKDEGSSFGAGVSRSQLRSGLVVAQLALCLMLLLACGLLLRGLGRARVAKLGFDTKNVLVVQFRETHNQNHAEQFDHELTTRLEALPGVRSVCRAWRAPLYGPRQTTIALEGGTPGPKSAFLNRVTANYFETIGIPILHGRTFSAEEMRSGSPVAIVTESTARNLWPNQEPVGRNLQAEANSSFRQVIGVARDAQTVMFGENDRSLIYLPLDRRFLKDSSMLIRTSRDAQEIQALVRAQARSLEPNMWLWTESLEGGLARSSQMIAARTGSFLAACLGLLALSLASIGLYGVLAYSVSHRTHEIGMRMALGAGRQEILRMVLREGMHLVAIGIGIGLTGGAAIGRVLSGLLFGLSPLDPITFVSVSLFLTVVALVALYLPARRAASIDPMVALRYG